MKKSKKNKGNGVVQQKQSELDQYVKSTQRLFDKYAMSGNERATVILCAELSIGVMSAGGFPPLEDLYSRDILGACSAKGMSEKEMCSLVDNVAGGLLEDGKAFKEQFQLGIEGK